MKVPITIEDSKYDLDLRRMYDIVTCFELLLTSCEGREILERQGVWTPEDEDMFGTLLKECREILTYVK